MVAHTVRRAEPPLRLTRRGRAVVLMLLALIACAASAVLFATASRASSHPATPAPTITVRPGDTLWAIATAVRPGRDAREAVGELRRLNHLTGYDLQPGQVLTLPRA
jgi:Tfp pilus assembly protein FimV